MAEGVWRTINGARVYIGEDGVPQFGGGALKSAENEPADTASISKDQILDSLNGYTDEQKQQFQDTLRDFTDEGYFDMRSKADGGEGMKILDNAIKASVLKYESDEPLYRGIFIESQNKSALAKFKVGAVINQKGTSSWSDDDGVAQQYAGGAVEYGMEGTPVIFKDITKGKRNALSVGAFSEFEQEAEVLYSGKAKWKINKMEQKSHTLMRTKTTFDYIEIEVEEVKKNG